MSYIANNHFRREPGFDRLFIFGAGGFAREVAWLVRQCWGDDVALVHLVDSPEYLQGENASMRVELVQELKVRGNDHYVVAVGNPAVRRKAVAACEARGLQAATLVHPGAEISSSVAIGAGSVICAGSILTVDIEVGSHVHINLDCTVGHDAVIGDYVTLSPGVHVSGNVHIGADAFIGTGANIIDGSKSAPLVIEAGAVVAAGACVTKSVPAGALVAGVPAVRKR